MSNFTFNKEEMKNFMVYCLESKISKITLKKSSISAENNNESVVDNGNAFAHTFTKEIDVKQEYYINSPNLVISVVSKLFEKADKIDFTLEEKNLSFCGFTFKVISSNTDEEHPSSLEPVKIAKFTKEQLKTAFDKDFEIVKSNSFVKSTLNGIGIVAYNGSFIKTAFSSFLGKFGAIKAELESSAFAAHTSPINFNKASFIFRKEYYDMINSFAFNKVEFYLPIRDSTVQNFIAELDSGSDKITFLNVYIQKDKAEVSYRSIAGKETKNKITVAKKVLAEIVDTYGKVCGVEDPNVTFNITSNSLKIMIDEIENGSYPCEAKSNISFNVLLPVMKYIVENVNQDNITFEVKEVETEDETEKYIYIFDGDDTYDIKIGN